MIAGFAKLVSRDHWPPPAVSASLASSLEASMGAFPDQIALELGKRAEDVEQRWPGLSEQGSATVKWIVCRVPCLANMGRHAGRA